MAKLSPAKPFVILMYGFPGSGKTYFARQLSDRLQVAHIHADRIRAELFETPRYDKQENEVILQLMNYMTGEFVNAGLGVVYDMNLMRGMQRRQVREIARKLRIPTLIAWVQIDTETAYARGQKRDRRRSDDRYAAQLDRKGFDSIAANMQNPSANEDYVVISGKHNFTTQYGAIARKMRDMGLVTMETANAHVAKPDLVNLVPNPAAGRVDMSRRNIIIR